MNTNVVIISGRMTKPGDLKFIPASGMAVMNGTLAVNGYKEDDVNFIDFVVFGKTAENIANFTDKGSRICITGRINQERWEKEGQKKSRVNVIANQIELLDYKKKEETPSNGNSQDFADDVFEPTDMGDLPF